jgi:hypothetical protein
MKTPRSRYSCRCDLALEVLDAFGRRILADPGLSLERVLGVDFAYFAPVMRPDVPGQPHT